MSILKAIGFIILVMLIILIPYLVFVYLQSIYRRRKYPDYDRELTQGEINYLEKADIALKQERMSLGPVPFWYSPFLYFGLVPVMLCMFGLLLFIISKLKQILFQFFYTFEDNLLFVESEVVIPAMIGMFAGILLAGYILYSIALLSEKLSKYVALNSDMSGFEEEKIHANQLAVLTHNIRARIENIDKPFKASKFLHGRNKSYRDLTLTISLALLLPTLLLLPLDARQIDAFYPDRIYTTARYFSIKQPETLSYDRVEEVEISCFKTSGRSSRNVVDYDIVIDDNPKISIRMSLKNIGGLFVLDKIFRDRDIQMSPRVWKEKSQYRKSCVRHFLNGGGFDREQIRSILHVDEFTN